MEAEVERLVRLGARRVRLVEEEGDFGVFTVMQDPEGNEFCVEA
jgi:predicted enzyme related to lactoylglutathione lyase